MRRIYFKLLIVCCFVLVLSQVAFSQTDKNKELPETSDEFANTPVIAKLSGTHLRAISIAYSAFQTETLIPERKRNIENYEILVKEYKDNFYIYFVPVLTKDEEPSFGGETSLGREVYYVINKKKFNILARYFAK